MKMTATDDWVIMGSGNWELGMVNQKLKSEKRTGLTFAPS